MNFWNGAPCMSGATKRCAMYEEERPIEYDEECKKAEHDYRRSPGSVSKSRFCTICGYREVLCKT